MNTVHKDRLTYREYSILRAVADTGSGVRAAERLSVSLQVVKNGLSVIRRKTGTQSTIQLVYWFGLGDIDDLLPVDKSTQTPLQLYGWNPEHGQHAHQGSPYANCRKCNMPHGASQHRKITEDGDWPITAADELRVRRHMYPVSGG